MQSLHHVNTLPTNLERRPGPNVTISVAVPTHKRPRYLQAALDSVLHQTRPPDEVIVSEDGSDPETAEVVHRYAANLPIRHLTNVPPLGELRNRRQAFAATHGTFVAMIDDDDEWEPTFLETTSRELLAHPECGFCSSDHWLMDADGQVLVEASEASTRRFGRDAMRTGVYDDVLMRYLAWTCFPLQHTVFRRDVIAGVGFVPGGEEGVAGDFSLFTELGAKRVRAYYVDQRLGRYRTHAGQVTRNRILMASTHVDALEHLARHDDLSREERAALAQRFRGQVVELAIAHAHARHRREALNSLRRYGELGWGLPPPRRLVVLAALLLGVRRHGATES